MAESRLAAFIKKLAVGLSVSDDPFDDDYFDLKQYLSEKEAEEEDRAAHAISSAHWKREKFLKRKEENSGRYQNR